MAAIANIAVFDGAGPPAIHTFTPRSTNPANYRNGSSIGSGSGIVFDETIEIDVNVVPNGVSKVKCILKTPHLAVPATGTPSYYETGKVEFLLPQHSTVQNREDLRVMLSHLLLDAQVVDAVDNLAYPY